ncbi:MAG: membrane-bound O-acyltransferase family protein, partial [Pseudomonadota bacterium]
MIFSTPIFVFGFLPLFLTLYYLAPARFRTATLLVASCIFYGWWQLNYLALVIAIAALSYVAGAVATSDLSSLTRKWAVRLGVTANLLILGWFKYAYFISDSFQGALER